jgi:voltage-gated potassium channel
MRKIRLKPEYDLTPQEGWLEKVYKIIYLSNTRAGKTFDIILLTVILLSTVIVMLETVPTLSLRMIRNLYVEFFVTILFTIDNSPDCMYKR